jgi:hypothetical protein
MVVICLYPADLSGIIRPAARGDNAGASSFTFMRGSPLLPSRDIQQLIPQRVVT